MGFEFGIKKPTHRIVIKSLWSGRDSKSFSISADLNSYQIRNALESFSKSRLKTILNEEVVFTHEKHKNKSHNIAIINLGDMKSKSFCVDFQQYSSEEIALELHKYLCGGEKLE